MENFLFFSVILDTCLGDSLLKMACLLFRELLKGPLYYAFTITWACFMYWRTSPIAIASICNLCAGDGIVSRTIFVYVFFFCLVRFGFLHAAWLFKHIYTYTPKYWTQIYIKVLNSFTAPFRYGRYCGEAFRKSETSLQQQQNNYWHCRYGNCWFLGLHRVTHIASGARNISKNFWDFYGWKFWTDSCSISLPLDICKKAPRWFLGSWSCPLFLLLWNPIHWAPSLMTIWRFPSRPSWLEVLFYN